MLFTKTVFPFMNVKNITPLMLTNDLQRYMQEVKIGKSEYKELCQWVQAGHSPYDNAWDIATDWGTPIDYISAKRIVERGIGLIAAYDIVNDEPIFLVQNDDTDDCADEELPF